MSVDAMLGSQPASKFPGWSVQGKEKPGYLGMETEASLESRERKEEKESTAKKKRSKAWWNEAEQLQC